MKTVVICSGGPQSVIGSLDEFVQQEALFIGADRGTMYLLDRGIVPTIAVGDFDSVTSIEYDTIQAMCEIVKRFNCEKDETDTELAVREALTLQPERVILLGVTGGRLDHMQSALHLLYRIQLENPTIHFSISDQFNEIRILTAGEHAIQREQKFQYCSFYMMGESICELTLRGFKYDVTNALLSTGTTKFTSNQPVEEVCTISIHKGICLMVRSSDS